MIDITPEDSVVPVYQIIESNEELAKRQSEHEAQEEAKTARETIRESALTKLSALGLTEEEVQAIIK
jgi:hypothetical protein